MMSSEFDKEVKKMLTEQLQQTKPLLSKEEAWNQIQTKRKKKKLKVKTNRAFGVVAAVAVIFIFFSAALPNSSSAYFSFTNIFYKIQDSVVQLFASNDENPIAENNGNQTPEIVLTDHLNVQVKEFDSMESLKTESDFQVTIPSYIPKDFELEKIEIYYLNEPTPLETYLYYEAKEQSFIVAQIKQDGEMGFNGAVQSEKEQVIETEINGYPATLVETSQEYNEIMWFTTSNYLSIEGNIPSSEIKKIATSIEVQ